MAVFLAVLGTNGPDGVRAAVRVHGLYDTMTEAREAVRTLVSENTETDAYIVDETARWIAVKPPAKDTAEEDEEIASKCNDAPSEGRMGSVCDILRPTADATAPSSNTGVSPGDGGDSAAAAASTLIPPTARKEAGTVQQRQLDELLRESVPSEVADGKEYARLRLRFATLTAFRAKLASLHATGESRCAATAKEIAELDARHPAYRAEFRAHYERGLRESGLSISAVPFLAYLGDDRE